MKNFLDGFITIIAAVATFLALMMSLAFIVIILRGDTSSISEHNKEMAIHYTLSFYGDSNAQGVVLSSSLSKEYIYRRFITTYTYHIELFNSKGESTGLYQTLCYPRSCFSAVPIFFNEPDTTR